MQKAVVFWCVFLWFPVFPRFLLFLLASLSQLIRYFKEKYCQQQQLFLTNVCLCVLICVSLRELVRKKRGIEGGSQTVWGARRTAIQMPGALRVVRIPAFLCPWKWEKKRKELILYQQTNYTVCFFSFLFGYWCQICGQAPVLFDANIPLGRDEISLSLSRVIFAKLLSVGCFVGPTVTTSFAAHV